MFGVSVTGKRLVWHDQRVSEGRDQDRPDCWVLRRAFLKDRIFISCVGHLNSVPSRPLNCHQAGCVLKVDPSVRIDVGYERKGEF